MESFIRLIAPIVIALVGFVLFLVIAKTVINRKDNESGSKEKSKDDQSGES